MKIQQGRNQMKRSKLKIKYWTQLPNEERRESKRDWKTD